MALPHFPSSFNSKQPIFLNLNDIKFNDIYLDSSIFMIENNKMYFNVNIYDGKVEPLETILKMIKLKSVINIEMINMDKNGTIIYKIIINNFKFLKINNLLNFDYNKQDIMKLDVTYTFDDIEYINLTDKLLYRSMKINKILKNNNNLGIKLTKEELGM